MQCRPRSVSVHGKAVSRAEERSVVGEELDRHDGLIVLWDSHKRAPGIRREHDGTVRKAAHGSDQA
jgi:hypothetical protein